jgi:transcription initiation factor IIE alpha subunit
MDTKNQVLKVFEDKGEALKSVQIAEILQIDKKEVDKAIQILKKEEKIISPKVCFYQIKS